jgi:hypothetical protein
MDEAGKLLIRFNSQLPGSVPVLLTSHSSCFTTLWISLFPVLVDGISDGSKNLVRISSLIDVCICFIKMHIPLNFHLIYVELCSHMIFILSIAFMLEIVREIEIG